MKRVALSDPFQSLSSWIVYSHNHHRLASLIRLELILHHFSFRDVVQCFTKYFQEVCNVFVTIAPYSVASYGGGGGYSLYSDDRDDRRIF